MELIGSSNQSLKEKIKCYYLYLLINPKILSPLIATGFSKEGLKKISTRPRANTSQKKDSKIQLSPKNKALIKQEGPNVVMAGFLKLEAAARCKKNYH